jgi:hypothetical protein
MWHGGPLREVQPFASLNHRASGPSVITPQTIVAGPTNVTVLAQLPPAFNVSAAGAPPLAYQRYFNDIALTDGGNISGSMNSSLTITNTSVTKTGSYVIVVSNPARNVTNSPVSRGDD